MKLRYIILSFLLVLNPLALADKLFMSNNNATITPQTAYSRLSGKTQENLITDTTRTLQENHYEQGTLSNGLGAYTMHDDNTLTADNTLIFTTSPLDIISRDKVIETATKLANQLNQESVAVFLDGLENNIDITVTINSNMTYQQLTDKLTQLESHGLGAFTIYFKSYSTRLNDSPAAKIEWLTTTDKLHFLQQLFSKQSISSTQGEALLVFKDGHCENITG